MKIKPLFAWYDLWIGAYWDRQAQRLYILPVPCLGFVLNFGTPKPPRQVNYPSILDDEYGDGDNSNHDDLQEDRRCGCPYCNCSVRTEYGEPCENCTNHAHQG